MFYLTRIAKHNHTTKEPKQTSRLGTASNEITAGGGGWRGRGLKSNCGRPTLALASALVHQTKQLQTTKTNRITQKRKAKPAAGIDGQVASMLELHTRQIDTIDTTAIKRAGQKRKKRKTKNN